MTDVFIYDALRTPRGRGKAGKGGLANHHPQELLAQTLNTMAERKKLDKNLVEDMSIGCVTQVKEQGACIARNALIAAEWPEDVTGFTVNRFCGSGLEAINSIAAKIGAGFIDGGIGGGVESMSRVPMGSDEAMIDGLNLKMRQRLFMVPQGISADLIATREGFTRQDVDKFALQSQQKAAKAIENKYFASSMFAVKNDDGTVALDRDEHPRADTTLESLGGLGAAFEKLGAMAMGPNGETLDQLALKRYPETQKIEHVHTAGNSSGIVDGAAVVLMGSAEWGKKAGLKPRARIRSMATAGAEPLIMLTAPAPASQK
ncbi:MAG: acetyl-CoA C-acyltransferase, partial [Deltaproteobacteria bacterium]|nr:acetyl-CoA C-acyltransferase [Deltaproteobacteria bacterium]